MSLQHKLSLSLLLSATWATSVLADSASLRSYLTVTEADAGGDAVGKVSAVMGDKKSSFKIEVSKLAPSTVFDVVIAGQVEGTLSTSSKGTGKIEFRAPAKAGQPTLDFDPRGAAISLVSEGNAHLSGLFAGAGESSGATANEQTYLINQTDLPKARASTRFTQDSKGRQKFTVDVSGAPNGVTQLLVNGQQVAEFTIAKGRGKLLFEAGNPKSKGLLLDFDPRGASVDLVQGDTVIFTGSMKARSLGANVDKRAGYLLMIPAASENVGGEAKAKWIVTEKAVRKFSVELEGVEDGTYTLLINGVAKGTLETVAGAAEIEFSNKADDDGDELPLDFDVLLAEISLTLDDEVRFAGVFDPSVLNAKPAGGEDSRMDEILTSTGLVPAAKATARYEVDKQGRHRFKVEVEDAAVGVYSLQVGGVHRASIRVVDAGDGVEGEVEFSSVTERGKVALKFDPRGQLIEILDNTGAVLFSHIFGSGSAADAGGGDDSGGGNTPLLLQGALFAVNGSSGSVSYTYEREAGGRGNLKIEALGLAEGDYEVKVGGVLRGTLVMEEDDSLTEGELEFDDTPKGDEVLLDFDVAGQEISISQGETVFFSRVIPTE